ncbi:hypothetical protein C0J52_18490, partial [Blattella germanica]
LNEEEQKEKEEEKEEQKYLINQQKDQLIVSENGAELVKTTSLECLSEFGQQDSEYTEDYASVTQCKLSSLTLTNEPTTPVPKPRSHVPQSNKPEPENNTEHSELTTPPRPGTIAEREHLKWQRAVPLPNNPYSPENISKRQNRRSLDLFNYSTPRYGRDYYINQSKCASGARQFSPKVCDLQVIEQQALQRNVYRHSFRAGNCSSPNFTINPLFDHDKESDDSGMEKCRSLQPGFESGYSSSLDSLDANMLRLLPPSEPQIIEKSLQSLSSIHRSESLRDRRKQSSKKQQWGGSMRVGHVSDRQSLW